MGKIRQAHSLRDAAIKAMGVWICQLIVEYTPHYRNMGQLLPEQFMELLQGSVRHIKQLIDSHVPFHLKEATRRELFTVLPRFIEDIRWIEENGPEEENDKDGEKKSQLLPSINVALAFTDLLISPDLQTLSIDEVPRVMRVIFYRNLSQMAGLRHLNMGSMSGGWKTLEMEGSVLSSLREMRNLQHLVLMYDATDNLIRLLAEVCPKIQFVDFSCSQHITNGSVDELVRLKALRTVLLQRTGVSMEGHIKMLLNLRHLEDVGHYDEIGRCLEYLDNYHEDRQDLQLRSFTSNYVTTEHVEAMARNCPRVTKVAVFCNATLLDLISLVAVNQLRDLKLRACDFYSDQVHQLVKVKGCNITHLHLEHVDEVDMNALVNISQYCPGLQELVLYNCDLSDNRSLLQKKCADPPFASLERLTLAIQCDLWHLEFLLHSAVNIRYIHLGTKVPVTDDFIARLLKRNPLQQLEQLRVMFSDQLTIAAAYQLVEHCDQLTRLNELECWERVSPGELLEFGHYIDAHNFELDYQSQKFSTEDEY